MSKYCQVCSSEFNNTVIECPTHKGMLIDRLPDNEPTTIACDIYAAANEIEAERILSFLTDTGISTTLRRSNIAQLPLASEALFIVTVQLSKRDQAVDIVKNARTDGIISSSGTFLSVK